jgi:hypothetical protein
MPWAALRLVQPIGEQDMQIQVAKDMAALEAAPKFSDQSADLNTAEFRERVYGFYGVERPAFEPKQSEPADKKSEHTRRPHKGR